MRHVRNNILPCALVAISLFLIGVDAGDPAQDERAALLGRQKTLQARVEVLKREQEYLLFQKAIRDVDSKYLVIDLANRTARLMYKNRVLKDLRFRISKGFPALQPGMLTLTKKIEGKKDRHSLVFGKSFMVQWKPAGGPRREAAVPVITLTRKELLSVFYSLEEGAPAYLVP